LRIYEFDDFDWLHWTFEVSMTLSSFATLFEDLLLADEEAFLLEDEAGADEETTDECEDDADDFIIGW
jgi:hypothetical protein